MTTELLHLITPDDGDYDAARLAWNRGCDQHPALIVEAHSADHVVEAVRLARARGLKIAPQGTGHHAAALPALDDALLLRTSALNEVVIDPGARIAYIGAGAVWHDVIAAAAEYGLATPHGFAGGVGVTGYLLGGGLGWLARSHGFGSSFVRAFEVVTVDGEALRVEDGELFWGLRGGGSCGVIVTAIELELIELREVFAGKLVWPFEHAAAVAKAYEEWTLEAPHTVTSSLRLLRLPEPAVQLALAYQGADGDELVAPLRALAPTALDTLARVPAAALGNLAGDPEDPMPAFDTSLLVRTFDPEAFVGVADPALAVLEVRQLGGALCEQPGAIGGVTAEALVFASAVPGGDAALEAVHAVLAEWADPRGTLPSFDTTRRRGPLLGYDPAGVLVSV
jgi:FAD/FMN-containing dehydrogenase